MELGEINMSLAFLPGFAWEIKTLLQITSIAVKFVL